MKPGIEERSRNPTGLHKSVVCAMEGILERKVNQSNGAKEASGGSTKQCKSKVQKYNKVSKTTIICATCKRYTCGKHSKKTVICNQCTDVSEDSDV